MKRMRERIPNFFGQVCYVVFMINKFKICRETNKELKREMRSLTILHLDSVAVEMRTLCLKPKICEFSKRERERERER